MYRRSVWNRPVRRIAAIVSGRKSPADVYFPDILEYAGENGGFAWFIKETHDYLLNNSL